MQMNGFEKLKIFSMIKEGKRIRVEAYGSSNTQRRLPGMHWFDFVELGFKSTYGPSCGQFINSGVGGNTSFDLLKRLECDVIPYKPHLVIITIGGNDSNPMHGVSPEAFRSNLLELHEKISGLDAEVIFQTYYACCLEELTPPMANNMITNMKIICEVAKETNSPLHDNFTRWERMRFKKPEIHRLLMEDAMHVNHNGNMVIGLDLLRQFEIPMPNDFRKSFTAGYLTQMIFDELEANT